MTDQQRTDESSETRRKEPRPAGSLTTGEMLFLVLLLGAAVVAAGGWIFLH